MPVRRPDPPSVRYLAFVTWVAVLVLVLIASAIAALLGPGFRADQWEPYPAIFPLSAGITNMVLLPAVRLLPRVLGEEMPVLRKNGIAVAIAGAGALFAAVAWMLTGSEHAIAGVILGLSGVAICFPNDSRWRALGGLVEGDGPGRR